MIGCCLAAWCAASAYKVDWPAFVAEAHARYEAVYLARGAKRVERILRREARRHHRRHHRRGKVTVVLRRAY